MMDAAPVNENSLSDFHLADNALPLEHREGEEGGLGVSEFGLLRAAEMLEAQWMNAEGSIASDVEYSLGDIPFGIEDVKHYQRLIPTLQQRASFNASIAFLSIATLMARQVEHLNDPFVPQKGGGFGSSCPVTPRGFDSSPREKPPVSSRHYTHHTTNPAAPGGPSSQSGTPRQRMTTTNTSTMDKPVYSSAAMAHHPHHASTGGHHSHSSSRHNSYSSTAIHETTTASTSASTGDGRGGILESEETVERRLECEALVSSHQWSKTIVGVLEPFTVTMMKNDMMNAAAATGGRGSISPSNSAPSSLHTSFASPPVGTTAAPGGGGAIAYLRRHHRPSITPISTPTTTMTSDNGPTLSSTSAHFYEAYYAGWCTAGGRNAIQRQLDFASFLGLAAVLVPLPILLSSSHITGGDDENPPHHTGGEPGSSHHHHPTNNSPATSPPFTAVSPDGFLGSGREGARGSTRGPLRTSFAAEESDNSSRHAYTTTANNNNNNNNNDMRKSLGSGSYYQSGGASPKWMVDVVSDAHVACLAADILLPFVQANPGTQVWICCDVTQGEIHRRQYQRVREALLYGYDKTTFEPCYASDGDQRRCARRETVGVVLPFLRFGRLFSTFSRAPPQPSSSSFPRHSTSGMPMVSVGEGQRYSSLSNAAAASSSSTSNRKLPPPPSPKRIGMQKMMVSSMWLGEPVAGFELLPALLYPSDDMGGLTSAVLDLGRAYGPSQQLWGAVLPSHISALHLVVELLRRRSIPILSDETGLLPHIFSSMIRLRYIHEQLVQDKAKDAFAAYENTLQLPLQPLAHNLASGVYEVFEQDETKYVQYRLAMQLFLKDWISHLVPHHQQLRPSQSSATATRTVTAVSTPSVPPPPLSMASPLSTASNGFSSGGISPIDEHPHHPHPHPPHTQHQRQQHALPHHRLSQAACQSPPPPVADDAVLFVVILGCGRGPLIRECLMACTTYRVRAHVFAIEKNRSAAAYTAWRWATDEKCLALKASLGHVVEVIHTEGRRIFDDQTIRPVPPLFGWCDVVVSELLGSMADNELSPECLSGFYSQLQCFWETRDIPPNESLVSIPMAYTSWVAPMHSTAFENALTETCVKGLTVCPPHCNDRHKAIYHQLFVCNVNHGLALAEPKPIWTFQHFTEQDALGGAAGGFERHATVQFAIPASSRVSGLVGYFDAVLYRAKSASSPVTVSLSTVPGSHTEGMFSWFPCLFPLDPQFPRERGGKGKAAVADDVWLTTTPPPQTTTTEAPKPSVGVGVTTTTKRMMMDGDEGEQEQQRQQEEEETGYEDSADGSSLRVLECDLHRLVNEEEKRVWYQWSVSCGNREVSSSSKHKLSPMTSAMMNENGWAASVYM